MITTFSNQHIVLNAHANITEDEMRSVMSDIMPGKTQDAQIGGFLVGLTIKGATVTEITAAAKVMRSLVSGVTIHNPKHLVDTCGTGGDGLGLFNISTACAFVVAAAGAQVAKRGNFVVFQFGNKSIVSN
jgi:anthranilate phosphoribosyltransferase